MNRNELISLIETNLHKVNLKINDACERAFRKPEEIKLIAVTKLRPNVIIQAAIHCGLETFGENYAEEGTQKVINFGETENLEWHMIGHIQSRKVKLVCENFDFIQSIDSIKVAQLIDRKLNELNKELPVLIELNLSGEETKHGFLAKDRNHWEHLLKVFDELCQLSHLKIRGLMTMPPLFNNPEFARVYFKRARQVQDFLMAKLNFLDLHELSMGTSADFQVAIEEGATMIRIGEALFGPRGV